MSIKVLKPFSFCSSAASFCISHDSSKMHLTVPWPSQYTSTEYSSLCWKLPRAGWTQMLGWNELFLPQYSWYMPKVLAQGAFWYRTQWTTQSWRPGWTLNSAFVFCLKSCLPTHKGVSTAYCNTHWPFTIHTQFVQSYGHAVENEDGLYLFYFTQFVFTQFPHKPVI